VADNNKIAAVEFLVQIRVAHPGSGVIVKPDGMRESGFGPKMPSTFAA
jgi:hypothetical protein